MENQCIAKKKLGSKCSNKKTYPFDVCANHLKLKTQRIKIKDNKKL